MYVRDTQIIFDISMRLTFPSHVAYIVDDGFSYASTIAFVTIYMWYHCQSETQLLACVEIM